MVIAWVSVPSSLNFLARVQHALSPLLLVHISAHLAGINFSSLTDLPRHGPSGFALEVIQPNLAIGQIFLTSLGLAYNLYFRVQRIFEVSSSILYLSYVFLVYSYFSARFEDSCPPLIIVNFTPSIQVYLSTVFRGYNSVHSISTIHIHSFVHDILTAIYCPYCAHSLFPL